MLVAAARPRCKRAFTSESFFTGLANMPARPKYVAKSPADMSPPTVGWKIRNTSAASASAARYWIVCALSDLVSIIFRFWRRLRSLAAKKRARS